VPGVLTKDFRGRGSLQNISNLKAEPGTAAVYAKYIGVESMLRNDWP
jgi:hypothetical protein